MPTNLAINDRLLRAAFVILCLHQNSTSKVDRKKKRSPALMA